MRKPKVNREKILVKDRRETILDLEGQIDHVIDDLKFWKEELIKTSSAEPDKIYVEREYHGYDGAFDTRIVFERYETDTEQKRRIAKEEKALEKYKEDQEKQKEKERKEYERLKRKFGG